MEGRLQMKVANLLSAAVILATSTLPALAQETRVSVGTDNLIARCPAGPGGGRMHGGCSAISRLDLTDEQSEKLYQARQKFADQIGVTKAELKKESRHMRDMLTQPTIDRKAVQLTQDKINTLKTSLANAKLAFKLDFSETLTAEQRKQLRYKAFTPRWGKGEHTGAKVGESMEESTSLLSSLPETVDIDLAE